MLVARGSGSPPVAGRSNSLVLCLGRLSQDLVRGQMISMRVGRLATIRSRVTPAELRESRGRDSFRRRRRFRSERPASGRPPAVVRDVAVERNRSRAAPSRRPVFVLASLPLSELKPTEGAEDEQPRAALTRGRRPGRIRRLRGWLATPILWWTGNPDEIPPLEQSGWERGKADAIHAAKDGRTFGLVATAVTLAAPTAVGLATMKLPTGWQIALIVLAGVLGYMLVPVFWAAGSAIAAPTIQRNEASLRLQELTEASTAAAEVDRAKSQLAAALRTGHLLATISAPPLDQEWLAQTEFLIRDAVGELEAARLDPRVRGGGNGSKRSRTT
jgi:hypothetical protein